MFKLKPRLYFVAKLSLALILLSTLIGVASTDFAPDVSLISVLIICAIAAPILLTVTGFIVIISATFNQLILRNGGTDASWFWFNGEPPGLEAQRDELKRFKDEKQSI
jgi:hypothetical protein